MDSSIAWAIAFLGVALILFAIELFIPSGGLLGFAAAASLVTGIVFLFQWDTMAGLIGALVVLAASPFMMALALRVWPHTPIAKRLTLGNPRDDDDEDSAFDGQASQPVGSTATPLEKVGARGKALTDLRPVGTCMIDGRRTECLAERGMIRAGNEVEVVAADGLQVKVRQVE